MTCGFYFWPGVSTLDLDKWGIVPRFGFVPCLRYRSISFCGSTTLLLERPSPAAGWISFSGSTALVLEQPSPAAGWIFILW